MVSNCPEYYEDEEDMAILDNGLSIITVNKEKLLGDLRKNLAAHEEELTKAKAAFRRAVELKLTEMLDDWKANKAVVLSIGLSPPPDNRQEYKRVISMLEYSVAEEVKIQESEFRQYVLDEWHYKGAMRSSNAMYSEVLESVGNRR